jgi:hypothetical protein
MTKPTLTIRPYQSSDQAAVIALWHETGLVRPPNDPATAIALKVIAFYEKLGFKQDAVISMGKRLSE